MFKYHRRPKSRRIQAWNVYIWKLNYFLTWSVTGVYCNILVEPLRWKRSLPTSNVSPELLNFQRNVLRGGNGDDKCYIKLRYFSEFIFIKFKDVFSNIFLVNFIYKIPDHINMVQTQILGVLDKLYDIIENWSIICTNTIWLWFQSKWIIKRFRIINEYVLVFACTCANGIYLSYLLS